MGKRASSYITQKSRPSEKNVLVNVTRQFTRACVSAHAPPPHSSLVRLARQIVRLKVVGRKTREILSYCLQPSLKFQHVVHHLPTRALCACWLSVCVS